MTFIAFQSIATLLLATALATHVNRSQFHHDYAAGVPDVPYAEYIRAIVREVEERWPQLDARERHSYDHGVYWNLRQALRDQAGQDPPPTPPRIRALYIASAFESPGLELDEQRLAFEREIFSEEWFQESSSAYRDVVIDLWERYEQAGKRVPVADLLLLNSPDKGRPGHADSHSPVHLGDFYAELTESGTAARWYERAPVRMLGPVKAADAYFQAGELAEAERLYGHILENLEEWVRIQARLREPLRAARFPLNDADLPAIEEHAKARLAEIRRNRAPS